MYTRNYYPDTSDKINLPENYDGTAFIDRNPESDVDEGVSVSFNEQFDKVAQGGDTFRFFGVDTGDEHQSLLGGVGVIFGVLAAGQTRPVDLSLRKLFAVGDNVDRETAGSMGGDLDMAFFDGIHVVDDLRHADAPPIRARIAFFDFALNQIFTKFFIVVHSYLSLKIFFLLHRVI